MSTYSNVLGQVTEKENAFMLCVRQSTAQVLFKCRNIWLSIIAWPYLVCILLRLLSRAPDNNFVLLTKSVRTEPDSQCRYSTDCSDLCHTDIRLPQASYSTAAQLHVRKSSYDLLVLTGHYSSRTHRSLCKTGSSAWWDRDNLGKPKSEDLIKVKLKEKFCKWSKWLISLMLHAHTDTRLMLLHYIS